MMGRWKMPELPLFLCSPSHLSPRAFQFFPLLSLPTTQRGLSEAESVRFLESLLQLDDLLDSRYPLQTAHAVSFT